MSAKWHATKIVIAGYLVGVLIVALIALTGRPVLWDLLILKAIVWGLVLVFVWTFDR